MKRVVTSGPLERELGKLLLRSMSCDVPSASAKAATLGALGLASGIAMATAKTGVAGATVSKTGVVLGTTAAVGSSLVKAALMSTMLGLAIGAATIGVGAGLMHASSSAPISAPRSTQRPIRTESNPDAYRRVPVLVADRVPVPVSSSSASSDVTTSLGQTLATSPSTAAYVTRNEPPAAVFGPRKTDLARSTPAPPKPEPDSLPRTTLATSALPRETAQLDRARAALREGDFGRSLLESDRYDRAFDAGVLRQEAAVLRIEATFRAGDIARARSLFGAFVSEYLTNPHASRLRKLLGP